MLRSSKCLSNNGMERKLPRYLASGWVDVDERYWAKEKEEQVTWVVRLLLDRWKRQPVPEEKLQFIRFHQSLTCLPTLPLTPHSTASTTSIQLRSAEIWGQVLKLNLDGGLGLIPWELLNDKKRMLTTLFFFLLIVLRCSSKFLIVNHCNLSLCNAKL